MPVNMQSYSMRSRKQKRYDNIVRPELIRLLRCTSNLFSFMFPTMSSSIHIVLEVNSVLVLLFSSCLPAHPFYLCFTKPLEAGWPEFLF